MAKRRKEKKTYKYDCSLTGETFVLTTKAENPDELLSVKAWYEIHQEDDDRPEAVKKMAASLPIEESLPESKEAESKEAESKA